MSGCLAIYRARAALFCALLQVPGHGFVLMGTAITALSPAPRPGITELTLLYQAELLLPWNWVPGSQYVDLMGYYEGHAAAVL